MSDCATDETKALALVLAMFVAYVSGFLVGKIRR